MLLNWNILRKRNVLSLLLKEERVPAWCFGEIVPDVATEEWGFCGWSIGVRACVCLTCTSLHAETGRAPIGSHGRKVAGSIPGRSGWRNFFSSQYQLFALTQSYFTTPPPPPRRPFSLGLPHNWNRISRSCSARMIPVAGTLYKRTPWLTHYLRVNLQATSI